MKKILTNKYFVLAVTALLAVVVFMTMIAEEGVGRANAAALAAIVGLCTSVAYFVAMLIGAGLPSRSAKAILGCGVVGSILGTILGLLIF